MNRVGVTWAEYKHVKEKLAEKDKEIEELLKTLAKYNYAYQIILDNKKPDKDK